MRSRLAVLVALILGLCSFSALAGSGAGTVTVLRAHSSDIIMFKLSGGHVGKPACATATSDSWALSLTTHTGRAMYALLLSAQAQGKGVQVSGTGDCSAWPDREAPIWIYIAQP
jgi:hypothetical protein